MIGYVLVMILMGFVASYASICLKRATDNRIRPIEILQSGWLWAGGFLYVGASLLNIFLLKHLPYSVVVPLGALTYVWTMCLSHWLVHERITKSKVLGITVILIGVVLLALSSAS